MAVSNVSTPNSDPVSVVMIDDHVAIVEMMTLVIDAMPGFRVIGSAASGSEGLELVRRLQPAIVVLDLLMPGTSGLALIADLRTISPKSRVLIFSGNVTPAAIRGAISAGAAAYVGKAGLLEEFRTALQSVALGQTYFGAQTAAVIKNLVCRNVPVQNALTPREKVVLRHIAEGLSSKEIAAKLGISVHTVLNHRSRLMQKTGLHRVAQLSLYAARIGLVGDVGSSSGLPEDGSL